MPIIEITTKAVQYVADITGANDLEEAKEFLQLAIGLCNVRDCGAGEQLITAARGLVEYRQHAGPLNFQLEKADTIHLPTTCRSGSGGGAFKAFPILSSS